MAAAAAARLNGFNGHAGSNGLGPPGPHGGPHHFGPPPPHLMGGHSPFFRPPFPPNAGEFHGSPHMMPGPHHHFMGHPRPPFGPRPFMLMHQHSHMNHPHLPPSSGGQMSNGLVVGAPGAPSSPAVSSTNCGSNGFLQNFHQSVVGDLRAGKSLVVCDHYHFSFRSSHK